MHEHVGASFVSLKILVLGMIPFILPDSCSLIIPANFGFEFRAYSVAIGLAIVSFISYLKI